jgi:hypothetical protein
VCFRSHIEASSGLYTYLICLALEYSSTLYIYRLMHTYRYVSKAVCRVRAGSRCGLSVHISRGRPRYPPPGSSPPCVPPRAPRPAAARMAHPANRAANRAPPRSGRATPTGDADYALRTRSLRTTVYALTPI